MSAKVKPIVVLNRPVAGVAGVVPDSQRGVRRAVEHLAEPGHREITYVAGPEASWADGVRWRALRESSLELEIRVRRLGPFLPAVTGGMRAAGDVSAAPTSAMLACNDQLAIGLIGALTKHGVRIPDEVSVIGFDDIVTSGLVSPALTTVATPPRMMGATAVTNLIALIGGARSRSGRPTVLPVMLVVRASTVPGIRNTIAPSPGAGQVSGPAGAG